jgi:2-amino-4-hydroxy-6-hydroxymethyldihydropteridine diphosphokinase
LTAVVLGLGGNIGDTRSLMREAIEHLARQPDVVVKAVSSLYRTPPWGKTDQPPFLNAAVKIETDLSPQELLSVVLLVEQALGRERKERWGPRTIDIDILIYGGRTVDEPGLCVPHPRLTERAFALAPLVDVMPDAEVAGRPAGDWFAESDRVGLQRVADPGWENAL